MNRKVLVIFLQLEKSCCVLDGVKKQSAHARKVCSNVTMKLGRLISSINTGLELYPSNSGLENLLREARMAVVEDLCDSGSGDDSDGESRVIETATNDTIYTTFANNRIQLSSLETAGNEIMTFDEKLDKIVQHLEINKLMRLGTWYIMLQLIKIRRVVIGILLLVGGLFVHAILYRHKLMALSILIICLYQSKVRNITDEYMQKWIHQSTDKLGAVTWIPRAIAILPIVLKLFGHLKFMLFLQQDLVLSLIVSTVTSAVVILTWNLDETHPMKVWGRDKRLKFVAYLSTIMYWAIWCGNYIDTLRLLAPALIDGGGITLDSVSSEDIQKACRRAWKRLFNEVSADIKQRIPMDALFFMGLTNWIIDYWQQPTNLSFEMLSKMLSDCFSRLEKGAAHVFRPELRRLSQQMRDVGRDKDFELFVVYLKQSIATIPPSKRMGYFGEIHISSIAFKRLLILSHCRFAGKTLSIICCRNIANCILWSFVNFATPIHCVRVDRSSCFALTVQKR
jgi:hypothetical protein